MPSDGSSDQFLPLSSLALLSDQMANAFFCGGKIHPIVAEAGRAAAEDWSSKFDLMRQVQVSREMCGYNRVLTSLEKVEAKLFSDATVKACMSSVEDMERLHNSCLKSLKFRSDRADLVREAVEKKASVVGIQEVNKHFHLHMGSTPTVEIPEILLNDEKERRVLLMMHDVMMQGVRDVAGTTKIPPPPKRPPRVFVPPPEMIDAPPRPLTEEDIRELDGQ
jgi:hypothetical protein